MPGCPVLLPRHLTRLRITVEPQTRRILSVVIGPQIEASQAAPNARNSDRAR
jgi:hypothetical protein